MKLRHGTLIPLVGRGVWCLHAAVVTAGSVDCIKRLIFLGVGTGRQTLVKHGLYRTILIFFVRRTVFDKQQAWLKRCGIGIKSRVL